MVRLKCLPFKNYVTVCFDGEMIGFCFFVVHIENRRIVCVFIRVFAGHITDTSVCTSVLYCLLCGRRKRVVRVVKNTCHCVLNFTAPLHCCALIGTNVRGVLIPCKQLPIYFENIFTRKRKGQRINVLSNKKPEQLSSSGLKICK